MACRGCRIDHDRRVVGAVDGDDQQRRIGAAVAVGDGVLDRLRRSLTSIEAVVGGAWFKRVAAVGVERQHTTARYRKRRAERDGVAGLIGQRHSQRIAVGCGIGVAGRGIGQNVADHRDRIFANACRVIDGDRREVDDGERDGRGDQRAIGVGGGDGDQILARVAGVGTLRGIGGRCAGDDAG